MFNRMVLVCVLSIFALAPGSANDALAQASGKVHRLALQISDDSQQKMDTVLNVASNTTRYYTSRGEQVEI